MSEQEVVQSLQFWAHELLVWIGFGTVVGLVAKAIMPGRDPGGAVLTLLMGIAGSVIGGGTLAFFWEGHRVTPISPMGFICATGGALVLLIFFRLFARSWYQRHTGYPRETDVVVTARPHYQQRRRVRSDLEL